jgi:hypothetical protein
MPKRSYRLSCILLNLYNLSVIILSGESFFLDLLRVYDRSLLSKLFRRIMFLFLKRSLLASAIYLLNLINSNYGFSISLKMGFGLLTSSLWYMLKSLKRVVLLKELLGDMNGIVQELCSHNSYFFCCIVRFNFINFSIYVRHSNNVIILKHIEHI